MGKWHFGVCNSFERLLRAECVERKRPIAAICDGFASRDAAAPKLPFVIYAAFHSPGGYYAALGMVQLVRSSLPLYEAQLGYQIEENILKEHVWNRKKEVL
ncbi:hypothetical protein [uncultured Pelagimonas sp.]|uniref:hypothetical protein n=1 Tax=uncultured Pelagimonas sp. TaxID=1618102 RepID=UPI00262383D9|nr:hypothetical protein [uncultured Pelagimonas sp.]